MYSYFCRLRVSVCGWFHVESHLRDGLRNQVVITFQRDISIDIRGCVFLNVSPELFLCDFGWSNIFLAYLYGSWKKRSCFFHLFTHLFLRFSALLRALCFSLRSCQILSRPSFFVYVGKTNIFFKIYLHAKILNHSLTSVLFDRWLIIFLFLPVNSHTDRVDNMATFI